MATLTVGTNSYINLTDAEAYFINLPYTTVWDAGTDDEKEEVLIRATQMIDWREFKGSRYDSTQTLKFPRSGLYSDGIALDDDAIPSRVKYAVCELAIYLLSEDYTAPDDTADYESVKVGPVETKFGTRNRSSTGGKAFPPAVVALLAFAIIPTGTLVKG